MTPDASEELLVGLLADALAGHLRLTLSDAVRVMTAAGHIDPHRIAPVALARWAASDPRAAHILRLTLAEVERHS